VDLAADGQPVGDAGNSEAAVFVGGALIGGGGLVSGERLQSGVNDGAIFGRTVHHRRTRRRGSARALVRAPSRSQVAAGIGVREDVRAELQFGIDATRR
jgi:hypothetical protein